MILQTSDIKDIGNLIEPDKLEMTYTTPGWYIVYGVVTVVILIVIYKIYSNWRKNKYRRDAVKLIANRKDQKSVAEVNEILKIVAMHTFGRDIVARLSTDNWADFLNSKSIVKFDKEIFEVVYSNGEVDKRELDSFIANAVKWINGHR
ncbi:MAG: DUF4381 domain-containing protein [Bacteroidota bacterium]